jgi:hypothetical protein
MTLAQHLRRACFGTNSGDTILDSSRLAVLALVSGVTGGRVVSTFFLTIENGVVARRSAGTAMRCMWFGVNRDFCDSHHSSVHTTI